MRSHGTEVSREFYKYGKEGESVYDALVSAVCMRYTLIPYIYSMAHDVTATITFHWNDKSKTLTIGKRSGTYNGMITNRTFNVKLIGTNSSKSISYKGSKASVKL